MANKVRLSYRIDETVARMVSDMAQKYGIEKTLVVEIAIRQLHNDQSPLQSAFPAQPDNPPTHPHHS